MPNSDVENDRSRSSSPDDSGNEDEEMLEDTPAKSQSNKMANGASANAKDPNRPRRKKARRACHACQRAHLTCGDERPCQRCIKRGLQDVCQDGVRKKAKYLHDAPNEALLPGAADRYAHAELKRSRSASDPQDNSAQPAHLYATPSQNYSVFSQSTEMPPPTIHERTMSNTSLSQPSPHATTFNMPNQQALHSSAIVPNTTGQEMPDPNWTEALFESTNPALFNFDLASMNFGNHYGALEFGMLGHMATGAGDAADSESGTQQGSISQYPLALENFDDGANTQFTYGGDMIRGADWSNGATLYPSMRRCDGPHAYAIETGVQFTSPDNMTTPPDGLKSEHSPHLTATKLTTILSHTQNNMVPLADSQISQSSHIGPPQLKVTSPKVAKKTSKRPRDPTAIYTSVTSPYPYTAGFHQLIAYLQRRFQHTPSKTLAIAKSLASIRPSFIATNKTLTREDLIFMEKCFQRTLWEYEGFIEGVGTPTIVARRTGEIAAVGKEFQILTGWTKDILLGRAPNQNINKGQSGKTPAESSANSTGRVTGTSTPLPRTADEVNDQSRQQPVFLAELLDDDTVVQFYEDFARLAFGDSRGSVMGKGKLLKYRTKDDEIAATLKVEVEARAANNGDNNNNGIGSGGPSHPDNNTTTLLRQDTFATTRPQDAKKGISGERGMQRLGATDGKVDCAYCWTVKRDVFDIPMLIVMNFLPCI